MNQTIFLRPDLLLLVIYVVSMVALNCVLFMIASFYQKKFNTQAWASGFVLSLFLEILFLVSLLFGPGAHRVFDLIQAFLFAGSAIASALCSLNLFFIMRQVKK